MLINCWENNKTGCLVRVCARSKTPGCDNIYKYKKLKHASCEYDRWVVNTQFCKLRDTSDTLIWRACAIFQLKYGVCENYIYDMVVVDAQFHKFYGAGRSRVFYTTPQYLFLMKDTLNLLNC